MIDDESSVCLTVDNTPPNISASVSPIPIKSGDTLKIKAFSNNRYWYIPDDTANVTATILGKTFNMTKLSSWKSGSNWGIDYIIPQLSDGIYTISLTTTDLLGNYQTINVNYTVDNTPPVVKAFITPNKLEAFDFTNNRGFKIIAQSSSDTKILKAYYLGSDHQFGYLNGKWTLWVKLSSMMLLGKYVIPLEAIDLAGNVGTTKAFFEIVLKITDPIDPDGSGSDGSGSDQPTPQEPWGDYLPIVLIVLGVLLVIIGLMRAFPPFTWALIIRLGIDLLKYLLSFLFTVQVPWYLTFSARAFEMLTSIVTVPGFSLTALTTAFDLILGDIFSIAIGIILTIFSFLIPSGSIIGLIIALIGFYLIINTIIGFIADWQLNKL